MSLTELLKICGANAGGLKKFYTCLAEDVDEIPAPTANTLIVATDIVCKTGKNFVVWYFTPDTGKLTITAPGERDGKSRESLAEFFLPTLNSTKDLQLDHLLNCDTINLVEDQQGKLRIIGDLDRGANLDALDDTTGGAMTERAGSTLRLKYNSKQAPYYYTGAIPLTPAD